MQATFNGTACAARAESDQKRMLEVTGLGTSQINVYINWSSLDVLQTCLRKANFALMQRLVPNEEHPALTTGKAVHKALEVWYSAPKQNRKPSSFQSDENLQKMLRGEIPDLAGPDTRTASLFAFLEHTKSQLNVADLGARDRTRVVEILDQYFDHYLNDPFDLYRDAQGPMCERDVEFLLYDDFLSGSSTTRLCIHYFGTIDSVFQDRNTGEILICDHKTTSSLGKDFLNRIKPNFQYVGYFLAAREALKLPVKQFMVNGIQIAKTKTEFKRQFTYVTEDDIREFKTAVIWNVRKYVECLETETFPMSTPNACCMWGHCAYKRICEVPLSLQKSIISADYQERN